MFNILNKKQRKLNKDFICLRDPDVLIKITENLCSFWKQREELLILKTIKTAGSENKTVHNKSDKDWN